MLFSGRPCRGFSVIRYDDSVVYVLSSCVMPLAFRQAVVRPTGGSLGFV